MFDTELPVESTDNDSQPQDENNNAPVNDNTPVDSDEPEGDDPEPKQPQRPSERHVPVSALINERRRYQGTINAIRRELAELKKGSQRSEPEAETDYDKQVRGWQKQLGVTQLQDKLNELSDAIQEISGKVNNVDELSHGAQLAVRQYVGSVEQHALSLYDKNLGISKKQFDKLVAAEVTPDEAEEIFAGNYRAIEQAVERVKSEFRRGPGTDKKAAEVDKVRNLPRVPGQGGNAPKATPEEKPFTNMRDLHADAWEIFQASRNKE